MRKYKLKLSGIHKVSLGGGAKKHEAFYERIKTVRIELNSQVRLHELESPTGWAHCRRLLYLLGGRSLRSSTSEEEGGEKPLARKRFGAAALSALALAEQPWHRTQDLRWAFTAFAKFSPGIPRCRKVQGSRLGVHLIQCVCLMDYGRGRCSTSRKA